MTDFLTELLQPERLTHVVDVGASLIDGDPPYQNMLARGLCRVTGFEPQPDDLAELNRRKGPLETYLPHVIGRGGEAELKICHYPGFTSLLQPDVKTLQAFPQFQRNAEIRSRTPVQTHRLDDLQQLQAFDLLKIDVQGAEMDVFEGARTHLAQAVAVQTEVSFITFYEQQATQGEVDQLLRSLGFIPHCFTAIKQWPVAPFPLPLERNISFHQLLEADLLYVRNFITPDAMTNEQLKHLCLLMHHGYGSLDVSARCVQTLQARGVLPANATAQYVQHLNDGAPA